ncbi:MAG: hypothetical protein ABR589_04510 [Chthoniobacterales bacterium]
MKKLTLTLCAVTALVSASFAGTQSYSGKEMKQVEQAPCPTWYADNEWNLGISGVYAPTLNAHDEDTYLGDDHSWGGALDVKYFFRRYFGLGIQGFGVVTDNSHANDGFEFNDDNDGFVGGALGTFTFRYPIPCSRFAPYLWVGGGAIFGGGSHGEGEGFDFDDDDEGDGIFEDGDDEDARLMAQYGGGFEVRFTPRIGWTNDVSFNHVEGGHNDFFQIRSGINFAF